MERRSCSGRIARRLAAGCLALAALLLLSLALPVKIWRTGELPAPLLPVVAGGPPVERPGRIWIDTDPACGHDRTSDPDDCFAILLLARRPEITVVGISTVHGNAPLAITDSIARALVAQLPAAARPRVHRGSSAPLPGDTPEATPAAPAHAALRAALADGPLTIVALGPLTNIALAVEGAPELRSNVGRVVAVMGRRPGHLFHPAEGAGRGMLLGHGPVFTDFNVAQDRRAAARLVELALPTTLIPYEAARQVSIGRPHLDRLDASGGPQRWVAIRARSWLDYWRTDVGRDGFYPFDLVGAGWVLQPELYDCAMASAWMGQDDRLWGWLRTPPALLVGGAAPARESEAPVIYCEGVRPTLGAWLVEALTSGDGGQAGRE